jgi:hypothetical protein
MKHQPPLDRRNQCDQERGGKNHHYKAEGDEQRAGELHAGKLRQKEVSEVAS